ncbi:hypothetical protein OS493_040631 [Desmophyllum pertusum]|uniref:Uncharacterized protein n=1 Tax=Desmophyllum pertusum TaxID=174260 RepID=A0A9X0CCA0_9CNID|nr:hypothetical protein OS493_040631 [Desmophyllum pertusum]
MRRNARSSQEKERCTSHPKNRGRILQGFCGQRPALRQSDVYWCRSKFWRSCENLQEPIESCLSPGGVLAVELMIDATNTPLFTRAANVNDAMLVGTKENTCAWLRLANFDVEVLEERIDYSVTKSKWYDMLRGRFYSSLRELNDVEIEEGIDELERGKLKDLNLQDDIPIFSTSLIFIAKKGH